mgnify:CR=1 FL=1
MKDEALRQLGEMIAAYRKDRHITQQDFAEVCDISVRYLSNIKNGGANLTIANLIKIGEAIGKKPSEMLALVGL